MAALAAFVELHKKADLFSQAYAIAAPALNDAASDRMDVDQDEASVDAIASKKQ